MRISIFLSYPKRLNPREFDLQVYRARNLVERSVRDEGLSLDLFGLNVNII